MNAATLSKAYELVHKTRERPLDFEEMMVLKECIDYADDCYVTAAEEAATDFIVGLYQCNSCESFSKENCAKCPFNPAILKKK